jgi:hypothetical protein
MNDLSPLSKIWSTQDSEASSEGMALADPNDAAAFERMLHAPDAGGGRAATDVLEGVSRTMHEQESHVDRLLREIGKGGNPVTSLKLQQQLSDLYLTHSLAVKVIGKGTQALDSLMRLQ